MNEPVLKIAILEEVAFTDDQRERLAALGQVDYFHFTADDQEKANVIAPDYDVVVASWINPTHFILKMKPNSLVALMCTGYDFIHNLEEAKQNHVHVANLRDYCTEAVAEHLLGLLLGISKRIFPAVGGGDGKQKGFELAGKIVGVIGLGAIGARFAEIMRFFGAKVITVNRNAKRSPLATDVMLSELLSRSDIICISCSINRDSEGLIHRGNVEQIKPGALLISCVWNIITEDALACALALETLTFAALDATITMRRDFQVPAILQPFHNKTLFLTPWNAYNTLETTENQKSMLCDNIENYAKGKPTNIV